MSLAAVQAAAAPHALDIFGVCHTQLEDGLGDGTLILLGPKEPGFWHHVTATPEIADDASDPMDRWSRRVISAVADDVGGTPLFPFGEPARPFIGWALRSGRAWSSPVMLLVHDTAGLMVSYRGAILLPQRLDLPGPNASPCESCATQPCRTACPVAALSPETYDLPQCHTFLGTPDGTDCMTRGCAARRACPISQSYGRSDAQSAYHMQQFHPAKR